MCDYSLESYLNRDAAVGDKLLLVMTESGSKGFKPVGETILACVKPGMKLTLTNPLTDKTAEVTVRRLPKQFGGGHRDAVEFAGGALVLLQNLVTGTRAEVHVDLDKVLPLETVESEPPVNRNVGYVVHDELIDA